MPGPLYPPACLVQPEPYIEPNDNEIEEAVDEAISWRVDVFVLLDADLCFMERAFRNLHDREWAHRMALHMMH